MLLSLIGVVPRLLPYALSFLTLGIFWVGEQTQLSSFARSTRALTWIHLAFLPGGDLAAVLDRAARAGHVYQGLYAVAALTCLINTYLAIGLIVALQLNAVIAPRIRILDRA